MISSESINFSKYSMINENNKQSNDLEIVERKENLNKTKEPEELSQKLVISNPEQNNQNTNNDPFDKIDDIIYSNPYETIKPKYIGTSLAFFYDNNGNPRITIGPDCKFFLKIIL